MMRSWTRRNGSSPLGSLSLDPRCGKIRADVNRQIIQKIAHTAEGGVRSKSLFGSGLAGLGLIGAERDRMIAGAFTGGEQGAFISFVSVERLWKVITPKRWGVLRAMTGGGPLAIGEVARPVGRDVKSVHGDLQALLKAGVIDRVDDGQILFPYDEVHVDFVLRAA